MNAPAPGQLWLVRPKGCKDTVVAIRSREQQDSWTVLGARGQLSVLLGAAPLRPVPGDPVPATASWDERVALLAGFRRPAPEHTP